MTSSSSLDPPKTNASSGRLNSNSSWCSATSDEIPLFLQIDLGEIHFITAASSQSRDTNSGSFDSVMSYKLRYSTEGVTWTFYQQNGIDKIFLGNLVEHFTTKNHLALPVKARYVQFYPVSMINSACMRVELYGEKALEENTDIPPVYQRSFLLDSENRRLFVCNKDVPRGKPACYLNKYGVKEGWLALDRRIVSILGYSKMQDMIYGVAPNRRSYVRCNITKCMTVVKTCWLAGRESQTTVLATEIAFIPVTGHDLTDAPISVYNLNDAEGNTWSASAVGLHFKEAPSQTWELKARWRAKDLNECYSSPCENGGSCVGDYKNYTCICTKDWLGRNCEIAHNVVPPTLTVYISAASCSGTKDDANRIIKSPGYPSSYSDNEDCTWELVSSHRIKLTFTYFVTEANYDYLYVYDGDSTSSQFEKWSGVNTGEVQSNSITSVEEGRERIQDLNYE
ncbi:uncharacterized protein [Porites lutea]|uniref:uncharacterized protein n=1 Tax=Porites lutea TaxID=51062 RepID=UPI003CC528B8